ncbi:hypothetical protein JCM19046_3555 [Bacillus sp. JCM 19046]|nr:hypothetical protein JCM19046_3555 [Bacillus sp. JCM 19046]
MAKLGRIGGKDGYKTRHEIELRLATQTPPTRPSLRTSMSNTRTRGVQALNTYAKNMKMSATIATGQASLALKGATGQVKDRFVRGVDNLQTNLNGNTPALAPAGGPVNHVPYNAMDSRKIQQDVGGVKQEQLRKIEVGSGVDIALTKNYIRDVEVKTGRKLNNVQKNLLKNALRENHFAKLSPTATAIHRAQFSFSKKNDLIHQWETQTGEKWPVYSENLYSGRGNITRRKGDYYDAHHIIENGFGGPHEWWNIHPARYPDQHQPVYTAKELHQMNYFQGGKYEIQTV